MNNRTSVSTISVSLLSAILVTFMPVVHADDAPTGSWTGNVSGLVGVKSLDDDWQDLDSQIAIGVIADVRQHDWPVSIAADLLATADVHESGSNKDTAVLTEVHLGARKVFEPDNSSFRPYIGAGVAFVRATLENENAGVKTEVDDNDTGVWAGVGTYYDITSDFHIGLDVRYSDAEVTLRSQNRDTGGIITGLSAGYHW